MKSYIMYYGEKCHRDLCWTLCNYMTHTLTLGFVSRSAPEPNIKHSQIKHWHKQANLRLLCCIWGNIKHSLICSWKCGTMLRKLLPGERNKGKRVWCCGQIYNWGLGRPFKGHIHTMPLADTHSLFPPSHFPQKLSWEIPFRSPSPLFILTLPSWSSCSTHFQTPRFSFLLWCHCSITQKEWT